MKKQILTFAALIILSLNSAHANECEPENMAGTWVNNQTLDMTQGPNCGKTIFESTFRLTLFAVEGKVTGYGFFKTKTTYANPKCKTAPESGDFTNIGLSDSGNITFVEGSGNTFEEECSMNAAATEMKVGESIYKRVGAAPVK